MNIQEVILCKFGEVILKGANRQSFESQLLKELRRRASPHGSFKIYFKQSIVYIEPRDEFCDMDGMYEAARRVFGIIAVNRAAVCEKNMESIRSTCPRSFSESVPSRWMRSARTSVFPSALPKSAVRLAV